MVCCGLSGSYCEKSNTTDSKKWKEKNTCREGKIKHSQKHYHRQEEIHNWLIQWHLGSLFWESYWTNLLSSRFVNSLTKSIGQYLQQLILRLPNLFHADTEYLSHSSLHGVCSKSELHLKYWQSDSLMDYNGLLCCQKWSWAHKENKSIPTTINKLELIDSMNAKVIK